MELQYFFGRIKSHALSVKEPHILHLTLESPENLPPSIDIPFSDTSAARTIKLLLSDDLYIAGRLNGASESQMTTFRKLPEKSQTLFQRIFSSNSPLESLDPSDIPSYARGTKTPKGYEKMRTYGLKLLAPNEKPMNHSVRHTY